MTSVYKVAALLLLSLLFFENLSARTIKVSSLTDLQTAINNAVPGDIIILTNGIYTSTNDVIINNKGTEAKPITITTEIAGSAEITGAGGFILISPATYIIIKGFKFTHAAAHAKSANGTSFCRWTQNIFETPGKGDYLSVSGSDHQIDYNTFQNKNSAGKFIAVRGEGTQVAQRLWIHHN